MKKFFITILAVLCCLLFSLGLVSCAENKKTLTAQEIYEKVSPSVVVVTAESPSLTSSGTGFFYKDGSTILTNYHVIKDCVTASITLSNGIECEVLTVLGYDKEKDIALLKVNYTNGKPLDVRTTEVKTGETVYAIGNSLGFLGGSLSEGIVSTAKRELEGQIYIQTTTAVTHGNSGGPLIDSYGKVIGIISAGFGDGLDLNLAIPIAMVDTVSASNPSKLDEIINVEWISNRQVWHQDENDRYVLVFTLSDANENPVAVSGHVIITITNDYNETVYKGMQAFDKDDFQYWYYDNYTVEKYQATIYINDSDITPNYCATGDIEFIVIGKDYIFDKHSLVLDGLPQKSIYNDVVTEKTVYTAQEFVDSINHNRTIILGAEYYDFSDVDITKNMLLQSQSYNRKGFVFNGVYNLSIKGNAEIVIADLSSIVLSFSNCTQLTLNGLTVGHINPSNMYSCEGAVVYLSNCKDVTISDCKLFGCGSIGVDAVNTTALKVIDTEIYDCTYTGISLSKSTATFETCRIYDLPFSDSVVNVDASTVSFNSCVFSQTNVTINSFEKCFIDVLDYAGVSSISFNNCNITKNTFSNIATDCAKNIIFKDCTFSNNNGSTINSGVKYQNCTFN